MKKFKALFLLCRPWSLTATAVPFMFFFFSLFIAPFLKVGVSCGDAYLNITLAFIAACALQIACNLLNTWGDNDSGVDNVPNAYVTTPQIMQGYVTSRQVLLLALFFLSITVTIGTYLMLGFEDGKINFNWLLFAVGVIGVLGASNYATLLRFKYHGLGTPFVFFLMGPIFYIGIFACLIPSEFFFDLPMFKKVVILFFITFISMPIASLVSVILFGNDMRDRLTDEAAGIKTLATILKPRRTLKMYWILHIYPYLHWVLTVLLVVGFVYGKNKTEYSLWEDIMFFSACVLPFLALPLTVKTLKSAAADYRKNPENPYWFGYERASGKIHFIFGFLYSLSMATLMLLG